MLNRKLAHKALRSFAEKSRRFAEQYPYAWLFEYAEPDDEYSVRIYCTKCGACKFLTEKGLGDIVPYLCNLDFVTAEKFGAPFYRNETIACGDKCCANYEKIRKKLVGIAEGYMNDETDEEKAYGHTFFEAVTVPESYRDKYLHSMALLKDMLGQKDFTTGDFSRFDGKVLLLHPEKDIFSKNDQEALTELFSRPEVHTMTGGHIAFVVRYPEYIALIREFLKRLPHT